MYLHTVKGDSVEISGKRHQFRPPPPHSHQAGRKAPDMYGQARGVSAAQRRVDRAVDLHMCVGPGQVLQVSPLGYLRDRQKQGTDYSYCEELKTQVRIMSRGQV